MRTSAFNCRRNLGMAAFLFCFSMARILIATEPAPAAKTGDATVTEDRPADKSGSSTGKSKLPQKPETFESLFHGPQAAPVRMPPPVLPNKEVKKALEDRENWIFIRPEDVIEDYKIREHLALPQYGPD